MKIKALTVKSMLLATLLVLGCKHVSKKEIDAKEISGLVKISDVVYQPEIPLLIESDTALLYNGDTIYLSIKSKDSERDYIELPSIPDTTQRVRVRDKELDVKVVKMGEVRYKRTIRKSDFNRLIDKENWHMLSFYESLFSGIDKLGSLVFMIYIGQPDSDSRYVFHLSIDKDYKEIIKLVEVE